MALGDAGRTPPKQCGWLGGLPLCPPPTKVGVWGVLSKGDSPMPWGGVWGPPMSPPALGLPLRPPPMSPPCPLIAAPGVGDTTAVSPPPRGAEASQTHSILLGGPYPPRSAVLLAPSRPAPSFVPMSLSPPDIGTGGGPGACHPPSHNLDWGGRSPVVLPPPSEGLGGVPWEQQSANPPPPQTPPHTQSGPGRWGGGGVKIWLVTAPAPPACPGPERRCGTRGGAQPSSSSSSSSPPSGFLGRGGQFDDLLLRGLPDDVCGTRRRQGGLCRAPRPGQSHPAPAPVSPSP